MCFTDNEGLGDSVQKKYFFLLQKKGYVLHSWAYVILYIYQDSKRKGFALGKRVQCFKIKPL